MSTAEILTLPALMADIGRKGGESRQSAQRAAAAAAKGSRQGEKEG